MNTLRSEADQGKDQTGNYKDGNKPGMVYIVLLQLMMKWRVGAFFADTKLALGPLLLTPNGIFCPKTLDPSGPSDQPNKLPQTLQSGLEPMPCRTVRLYFAFLRASRLRVA